MSPRSSRQCRRLRHRATWLRVERARLGRLPRCQGLSQRRRRASVPGGTGPDCIRRSVNEPGPKCGAFRSRSSARRWAWWRRWSAQRCSWRRARARPDPSRKRERGPTRACRRWSRHEGSCPLRLTSARASASWRRSTLMERSSGQRPARGPAVIVRREPRPQPVRTAQRRRPPDRRSRASAFRAIRCVGASIEMRAELELGPAGTLLATALDPVHGRRARHAFVTLPRVRRRR